MANTYMPIGISVKGRTCLVVGGGAVALRKVENLLNYETDITVIALQVDEKLMYFAESGRIKLEKREYRSPEAGAFGLVISASDDAEVNRQVCDDCREASVLVNVVDDPRQCDFIFPAVVNRDCLAVAITTDGRAPFMSGHLRQILENIFPEHWNRLMKLAAQYRLRAQELYVNDLQKKHVCYDRFLESDWKSILKDMSEEEVQQELERLLTL